jgi:hypothetical protein
VLTLPAPSANAFDGDQFRADLATAGLNVTSEDMYVADGQLVFTTFTSANQVTVERVLARHRPPPPTDPHAEFRAALQAATSWQTLRDALLGETGPGAELRQPTGR